MAFVTRKSQQISCCCCLLFSRKTFPGKSLTRIGYMLYWGIVYIHRKVIIICPSTNMNAINAGNHSKKCFAFPRPIRYRFARVAPVKILIRKFLSRLLLEALAWGRSVHLPAVAVLPGVFPERDNLTRPCAGLNEGCDQ